MISDAQRVYQLVTTKFKDGRFTRDDIIKSLSEPASNGSVSSALTRFREVGVLKITGTERIGGRSGGLARHVYEVIDVPATPPIGFKSKGRGGKLGRKITKRVLQDTSGLTHTIAASATVANSTRHSNHDLAERLLSLASELDAANTIQTASTEELLAEIGRRVR